MSATQYEVPEWHWVESLRDRLESLAARASRCGTAAIVVEASPCWRRRGNLVAPYVAVSVAGVMPRIDGWAIVARVEHTEAGPLVSRLPGRGEALTDELCRRVCDHCRAARERRDTFVLSHEDGRMMRVGRSCLADFIRDGSVEDMVAIAEGFDALKTVDALNDRDWGETPRGGRAGWATVAFVAASFAAIRAIGWVSRSAAEDDGRMSTSAYADEILSGRSSIDVTDADKAKAREAIEWASSLEPASEFEANLRTVAHLACIGSRHDGLAAAIAFTFGRHLADVAARAARQPSRHFGEVGSRYVRALTVEAAKAIETQWGLSKLIVARDDGGNVFKWFASSCPDCVVGERYAFLFTVDKHEVYRDVRQTVITRAAIATAQTPENFGMKWVRPDGRVCKTKKEMVA